MGVRLRGKKYTLALTSGGGELLFDGCLGLLEAHTNPIAIRLKLFIQSHRLAQGAKDISFTSLPNEINNPEVLSLFLEILQKFIYILNKNDGKNSTIDLPTSRISCIKWMAKLSLLSEIILDQFEPQWFRPELPKILLEKEEMYTYTKALLRGKMWLVSRSARI